MTGCTLNAERECPDERLMERVAAGNREALAALMGRHQDAVLSLAYRFLGRRALAEDVAQDVFLRCWEQANRYRPTAKFTTWLYRVVVNRCWDLRRRARLRAAAFRFLAIRRTPVERESSDELDERTARVRDAVCRLPDRQRLAIVLHRYQELSHEQVAEITGWSVGAVESCLVRAYQTLRRELADLSGGR